MYIKYNLFIYINLLTNIQDFLFYIMYFVDDSFVCKFQKGSFTMTLDSENEDVKTQMIDGGCFMCNACLIDGMQCAQVPVLVYIV